MIQPEEHRQIIKEALCIMCGCCVSECNSMEADPDFLGPAALAKAYRFVGDVRDTRRRASGCSDSTAPHGVWDCTRCYFCNERCPKGVDPRDAIAKLGAAMFHQGITRDKGAQHAQVFVSSTHAAGYLRRPSSCRRPSARWRRCMDVPFALRLARAGKVPNPLKPHKAPKKPTRYAAVEAARGRGQGPARATTARVPSREPPRQEQSS